MYLNWYDFIGLVRCIIHFEGLNSIIEAKVDFHIEDNAYASIYWYLDGSYGIRGSVLLREKSPMGLLSTAAHEVGHYLLGHFNVRNRRFFRVIRKLRRIVVFSDIYAFLEDKQEREANEFAEKYSSSKC